MTERSPPTHHEEHGQGDQHLHRLIHSLHTKLDALAVCVEPIHETLSAIQITMQRMERKVTAIATREQFDAAVADVKTKIADESLQVSTKVAALGTLIEELRAQLASGAQVTDADLVTLGEISASIGAVLPDDAPASRRR